jgi:hypothetical protein
MGERRRLRWFGLLVGGIFAVISHLPVVLSDEPPRIWALAASAILVIPALVMPSLLKPIYGIWMFVGHVLGWVNTRIILGVLYYLLFTPAGFLMRRFGSDPMRRKPDPKADTYRVLRQARPASHMKRQF